MVTVSSNRPDASEVWSWLEAVADPEIPVISVVDLGIVRDVLWDQDGCLVVHVTPTYSGCPATRVIASDIAAAIRDHGVTDVRVEMRLSPAWTTDWMSDAGRQKLREFGIAPPAHGAHREGHGCGLASLTRRNVVAVECPRCGSLDTREVSEFGSTPCKSHHVCKTCLEPFDRFKEI